MCGGVDGDHVRVWTEPPFVDFGNVRAGAEALFSLWNPTKAELFD